MKLRICIVLFLIVLIMGCGKIMVEQWEEIQPDETAFVIPLEGVTSKQKQFESVLLLEKAKVASKRIIIPQRKKKLGRGWWNYQWVRTVKVITISRKWITREWTQDPTTGTATKNEALEMESQDSIGFAVPCVLTAYIKEENAALFLYNFGGQQLNTVIDTVIRGSAQGGLTAEFGQRDLTACKIGKAEVFDAVYASLINEYIKVGITIQKFEAAGQLYYLEEEIQDAINAKFVAEQLKETNRLAKLADVEKNEERVNKAKAARAEAEEWQKAEKAMAKKIEMEVKLKHAEASLKYAEALMIAAEKGQPIVPKIAGGGNGMIFQITPDVLTTP